MKGRARPPFACRTDGCGFTGDRAELRVHRWVAHRARISAGGRIWDGQPHPPKRGWVRKGVAA